jgi:hypothetical protein
MPSQIRADDKIITSKILLMNKEQYLEDYGREAGPFGLQSEAATLQVSHRLCSQPPQLRFVPL